MPQSPGPNPAFPNLRLRRLRQHPALRELVRETEIGVRDLILPLFVRHGSNVRQPIASMPGHAQISVDLLSAEIREIVDLGIPAVILFGIPAWKDMAGSAASRDDGVVQQAIRKIKETAKELLVITDLCFCEYTDHGHCGVVVDRGGRSDVDNDATLELLAQQAGSHPPGGARVIAPTGLMAGVVGATPPRPAAPGLRPPP